MDAININLEAKKNSAHQHQIHFKIEAKNVININLGTKKIRKDYNQHNSVLIFEATSNP